MPLHFSLSVRLIVSFLTFVVLGSLALVLWLGAEEQRHSREQFAAMARTNAEFVRTQKLPLSARTADALGEVLGVRVCFITNHEKPWLSLDESDDPLIRAHQELIGHALARDEVWSDGKFEVATSSFDSGGNVPNNLVLVRAASTSSALWQGRTFAVLAVFWLLSLALAWAFASGIVRPLRALAQRLPRIADEKAELLPEASRTDEIGQLARAYEQTHTQLAAERRAREQAERLATLGRMATGLAHEINNPVAAIKLHAQLLEEGATSIHPASETPGAGIDSLSIILAENAKIEALVNQWMFLARPQPPQTSPCDPATLITTALRIHAPAAAHAGVTLLNETHPCIRIAADARRLGQAIGNVIVNAIQAMAAKGGTLTIRSYRSDESGTLGERPTSNVQHPTSKADAPVQRGGVLPLNSQPSTLNLQFTDTGPGFSAAALTRHAELFFSEKEGGMGIGLNVTAEILRAHGGELRVANSPTGGAIVTFILPLTADAKSEILNPKS